MLHQLTTLSKKFQFIVCVTTVAVVTGVCFIFSGYMDYRAVAFILFFTVSLMAVMFDFKPVLVAASLSAVCWNFLFIEPRFTFNISAAEDVFLFLMYFVIVLVNAVLTTRIRRVEKRLRDKEEKEKTMRLYNTLLNSLSHELKTPIAAIIAASDNLLTDSSRLTEESRKELLSCISVASLRLNRQVENLLSMSRLESGFIQPKKDWTDITELIYEVVHRLEPQLKQRSVHINVEETLPLYKIDMGLIEQVLFNLLYNASLYTPEHGDIFITASNKISRTYLLDPGSGEHSELKKESSILILTVEDRGPGFPPEEINRVFDKFYRLSTAKTGGTGLGLSIVKGFVEAHDGTVLLENVPHGAKFSIEIPAETSYINNLKNE